MIFVPLIIESRLALSMHTEVREQLESSALFYKEFFQSKKREFSARAEAISRDPVLQRAARAGEQKAVASRLEQVLADDGDIRSLTVRRADQTLLARREGPKERQGDNYQPKTIAYPLGVGEAPFVEAEFILPRRYFTDRAHAEEISTLYDASFRTQDTRADNFFYAYFSIAAFVMIVALALGFYLARGVTRRVVQLAAATERVARGESGFTVPLGGDDEITELTFGFNRMIEEVADARDRIVYLEKVSGWQEFARRLAHEIKNPLTPIRLAIQELRRRAPEEHPEFKRLVDDASDVVEEEIGALTRLVDEFSQFARLPEVATVPLEFNAFILEFMQAYNNFEPEAEVKLELPDATPVAALDRVLMRRVLANLVTNGIQAAGAGRAKLSIRVHQIPATNMIELRVEDNGPGVSLDRAEKIFVPYFTTKADGTGLGLAIVKKIILHHSRNISLRRAPTGGAAFVVMLPPAPEGATPEGSEADEEAKEIARRSQTRLPLVDPTP